VLSFALLALAASRAGAALPEGELSAGHPCLFEDEAFAPLHIENGVDVGLSRLEGGTIVLRARASLDAPLPRVAALLEDVARWPGWIGRLRSLERLPGETAAYHAFFRAPWPLADREYAFRPAIARRPNGMLVFWEDASARLPAPTAGRVRVSPVRGCFAVRAGTSENVSAFVYTETDSFAAGLPEWMRRPGWRRGPVRLVDGLRARLREN
jgi:hypothetical protein